MALKLSNNGVSRLAAALNTTDTTALLLPGVGSLFPALSSGD